MPEPIPPPLPNEPTERTLAIAKPDAVRRGLTGEVVRRFERAGLRIEAMRMLTPDESVVRAHYAEWASRAWYDDLVHHNASGPVVAMVVSGPDAVATVRRIVGGTNPGTAQPATIRGDLGLVFPDNLVHGTHAAELAEQEIARFFPELVPGAGPAGWPAVGR